MTFENKTEKYLRKIFDELELAVAGWELLCHQWFRFSDASGLHYCQLDFALVGPEHIVLIECKRSQTEIAELQMRELYIPVLRDVYKKPVVMVQAFNIATYDFSARRLPCPSELCFTPKPGVWYWHYVPL